MSAKHNKKTKFLECFVENPQIKQKLSNIIKMKCVSFFSITQLLLVTTLFKTDFGLGVAFNPVHYLSIGCPNTSKPEVISCFI